VILPFQRPGPAGRAKLPRRGASLVEFALVAPVFILFVMGIIELGRVLMVQHLLTNAARQGCRVGVIGGTSTPTISSTSLQSLSSQGVSASRASVQVNDGSADASTAKSGDEITVMISVPMSDISWVPLPAYSSGTLTGRYTLRRE
jgi:Flp pilus assembly protein TadG